MLPDMEPYGRKTYIFRVQSPEDFKAQLHEQNQKDLAREQAIDVSDLSLARTMLKNIGVECKE